MNISAESTFGEKLKNIREQAGLTLVEMGKKTNVSHGHLSKLERNQVEPSDDLIWRICYTFGISPRWLKLGEEPREMPRAFTRLDELVKDDRNAQTALFILKLWALEGVAHLPAGTPEMDWGQLPQRDTLPAPASPERADAYIFVPQYDIASSAGDGIEIHSEQIVDYLAFKQDWLWRELHVRSQQLALISAHGDSMEPTIQNGDLLLIDLSQQQVTADAIYVLRLDDFLKAKRLQRLHDGTIRIRSDNPAYEVETILPDEIHRLAIIGRVVWFGRSL